MKKNLYIIVVLCLFSGYAFAQQETKTIVDELNSPKLGQGNIKVMQEEAIQNKVAIHHAAADTISSTGLTSSTRNGYKIQAYSGNNQQKSKREAEYRQGQMKDAFPELETRVSFQSPFWRLHLGNYTTQAEAQEALKQIKERFPSFGREMYVVRPGR